MNAKLCKRLRKAAREATVGQPVRGLRYRKVRSRRGYTLDRSTVENHPGTTRGVYRAMKREELR